jgi:hypothetical protein
VPGTCARSRGAARTTWDHSSGHGQGQAVDPPGAAPGGQGDGAVRETPLEVMSKARQLQWQLLQALPTMSQGDLGYQGAFEAGRGRGARAQGRLSARMQDILARQKQQQQVQQQRSTAGAAIDGESESALSGTCLCVAFM